MDSGGFAFLRSGDLAGLRHALAANPMLASARNAEGASLLMLAAYQGHADAVAAIRAALPALDFYEAIIVGDTGRLESLLAEGFDANRRSADGFPPLALAAFFRHAAAFDLLLPLTSDVDARAGNRQAVAALHAATAVRHAGMVEKLLRAGAEPDLEQAGAVTPLHAAAHHGDATICGLLLLCGADRGRRDAKGRTAADFAREGGHDWLAARLG